MQKNVPIILPPKKRRFQQKVKPSEEKDVVEKSQPSFETKICVSVIRHTSCPDHYIPVYKKKCDSLM